MPGRAPLIAVNGYLEPGASAKITLRARYADAVRRAGGLPLLIATPELAEIEPLLDRVDGVLLTGGDDFDTERLGLGPTHPEAVATPTEKQDFDLALARACLERGVPTLGICYGMQCLGLAGGAKLLQHLPEDRPGCREHAGSALHGVRITGEKLKRAVGVPTLEVVSRHHQALTDVSGPWAVAATDDEGLIEAIERADGDPMEEASFALGVQWHPELSAPDTPHARLFEALVQAARERAGQAPQATTTS